MSVIDLIQGLAGMTLIAIGCVYAGAWVVIGMVTKAGTDISAVFPRDADRFTAGLILWTPAALTVGMFIAAIGRAL